MEGSLLGLCWFESGEGVNTFCFRVIEHCTAGELGEGASYEMRENSGFSASVSSGKVGGPERYCIVSHPGVRRC